MLTGRFTHHNKPEMAAEDDPVWTALCGYQKDFNERILMMYPSLRKTAPKKDTRCRKCIAELPAYLELRAIQREEDAQELTKRDLTHA